MPGRLDEDELVVTLEEGQRRREGQDRATDVRGWDVLMVRRGGCWITIGESLTAAVVREGAVVEG